MLAYLHSTPPPSVAADNSCLLCTAMVDQSIKARARYLDESAHLLASTSPAISRHLRSQLHKVATDYNLGLSDAQKSGACGACGNLMIPGWTSRTYLDNGRSIRNLKKKAPKQNEKAGLKAVCNECLICNRVTRQPLPAPSKAPGKEPANPISSKIAATASRKSIGTIIPAEPCVGPLTSPFNNASSFTNASSKRRAKARKQSGLQALLAKKKEESLGGGSSTGFGLDLMDFMKTG